MILPAKHLKQDRALLGVGGRLLVLLNDQYTVSELWEKVQSSRDDLLRPISFDWFVLGLAFLYSIGAVELHSGVLVAGNPK